MEKTKLETADAEAPRIRRDDELEWLQAELDAANDRFHAMNSPTGREIELQAENQRLQAIVDGMEEKTRREVDEFNAGYSCGENGGSIDDEPAEGITEDHWRIGFAAWAFEALQSENQQLQSIVDRLPKSVDGVPIVNGMTVWTWSRGETPKPAPIRQKRLLYCWGDWCDVQTGYVAATRNSVPLCCVYSTREAAEKASVEK